MSVSQIAIQQLPLRISSFSRQLFDLGVDVPIADQDVGPAVVIKIKKAAAPSKILRMFAQAAVKGGVLKCGASQIVIEGRSIASKIRFDNVKIAVKIVIGGRYAHSSLRFAIGTERTASFHRDVGKFSVFTILIESAGRGIVGDVNVRPAVVVKIPGKYAEPIRPIGRENSGRFRYILECAVAIVVKKNILAANQAGRTARDHHTFI